MLCLIGLGRNYSGDIVGRNIKKKKENEIIKKMLIQQRTSEILYF